MLTCRTRYSSLVFGWPCGTGTRKIHELILVLSSSLTPSLCPLSPHMILLIDGGWFYSVVFYFIQWYLQHNITPHNVESDGSFSHQWTPKSRRLKTSWWKLDAGLYRHLKCSIQENSTKMLITSTRYSS